jgi:hypothetical protein
MGNVYRKRRKRKSAARKKLKTMDIILVVMAVLLVAFTLKMILVFEQTGAIPDTLCTCVFAALGGECGVMGWIKTTKDKLTDRKWQIEDRTQSEKEREENGNDI